MDGKFVRPFRKGAIITANEKKGEKDRRNSRSLEFKL
jgi:hypothetical protein